MAQRGAHRLETFDEADVQRRALRLAEEREDAGECALRGHDVGSERPRHLVAEGSRVRLIGEIMPRLLRIADAPQNAEEAQCGRAQVKISRIAPKPRELRRTLARYEYMRVDQ